MSDDRFSRIGKRMYGRSANRDSKDEKKETQRKRFTIYVDKDMIAEMNAAYKKVNHDFFPAEVQKSLFLETLIKFGIDNIDQVKERLHEGESEETNEGKT